MTTTPNPPPPGAPDAVLGELDSYWLTADGVADTFVRLSDVRARLARTAAPSITSLIEKHGSMLAAANEQDRLARTAAPSELRKAFMTLESSGNSDGRTIVLKFNRRDDAYAVHDFLLKAHVKDSPSTAPLEAQPIPTDLSKPTAAQIATISGAAAAFERFGREDIASELRGTIGALAKKGQP